LRARPEQTQLEDISDASFLGKLLVLLANVKLDWKVIARYKHSSLFGLIVSKEEKKLLKISTRCQCYKTFFPSSLMMRSNKLEGLPLETLSCQVLEFDGKARANPIRGHFRCFLLG
jgi:hypothetical protein